MKNLKKGVDTICAHEGEIVDEQFGGSVSPIFVSTSYEYIDKQVKRYPRYFNTPNQESLCKKNICIREFRICNDFWLRNGSYKYNTFGFFPRVTIYYFKKISMEEPGI